MTIGLIGGDFTLMQSYLSSGLSLNKFVSSLTAQNRPNFSTGLSYFNDSLFQQLGSVSSSAAELQSQLGRMASLTEFSSSMGRAASYTNDGVLSASVARNAPVFNFTTTNVDVTQLASGQQNRSAELDVDENSFGSQFSIGITDGGGRTNRFSVELNEQDNNLTAMQAMASRINTSGIGVRATLTSNAENGTVSMLLTSDRTGERNGAFTVTDDSAANLGNVINSSQDARYSVNGNELSSQSNDVRIMDGVTAILNRTGSTQITYTADFSRAVDDVQNFLDAFNNMRDAASGTPLDRQLTGAVNRNVWSLGSSGIGFDSNGNLSINDVNMLTEAISNGGFARNFQGISNFGSNLYDVTLTAHSTVYGAALQDSFSELMSSLSRSTTYGNWQNSASFMLSPGLIFSTWG
jgi:hypothetical protein